MTIQEIRNALLGKTINYYDSWNGNNDHFTIGYVQNEKTSIRVHQERGKGWGVWIQKKHLSELIESGTLVVSEMVDHCNVQQTWKIS